MIDIEKIYSFVPKNKISQRVIKEKFGLENYKKIKNYAGFSNLNVIKNSEKTSQFFFRALEKFFKIDLEHKKLMQLFFHLTQDKMKCLFLQLEFRKNSKLKMILFVMIYLGVVRVLRMA